MVGCSPGSWRHKTEESRGFVPSFLVFQFGDPFADNPLPSMPDSNSSDPIPSEFLAMAGDATQVGAEDMSQSLDIPIQLNLIDDAELLAQFCLESRGLLEEVESAILTLEQDPRNPAPVEVLFRSFHTFKGGAGFLRLDAVHCLTHDLESLLETVRSGRRLVDRSLIEVILACVDVLVTFLGEVESQLNGVGSGRPITVEGRTLHQSLLQLIDASPSSGEDFASPMRGTEPAVRNVDPIPASRVSDQISVSFSRLDEALGLVVQIREDLTARLASPRGRLDGLVGQIEKLDELLHSLLWVPTEQLFQRMKRVVRDASVKVGKPVRLVTHGGETLLDRRWETVLSECLMHLLRNGIDHGIEHASVRSERGKDPVGEVMLSAEIRSGYLCVDVEDDGAGIPTAKILKRGIQMGMTSQDANLSAQEIHELIFRPGFTTSDSVTALSGRGVGLDVVRSNVEKIGGSIQIHSEEGRGTRFMIQVPLPTSGR